MTEEPNRQDEDAWESEPNLWYKIEEYLRENPTLALTLLYLYVTLVGMIYSWLLYGRFGINIFDYSEIGDFLLAAFKNPSPFLLTVIQLLALVLLMVIVRWRNPESRQYTHGPLLRVAVLASALAVLVITGFNAYFTAYDIKSGEATAVEIRYRSFKGSAGQVTVPGLQFIGATQRSAFFYDVDAKRTLVIPQTQIISIEIPGERNVRIL